MKALLSILLTSAFVIATSAVSEAQIQSTRYHGNTARNGYERSRVWVPGRTEVVYRSEWIPARTERVWVEPAYRWSVDICGRHVRVLVGAGHWESVCSPGHYVRRAVRIYHPGHWVARNRH